jgi:hypothetical protein
LIFSEVLEVSFEDVISEVDLKASVIPKDFTLVYNLSQ